MKPLYLWIIAALLVLASLAVLFLWAPARLPAVAREGVRADGTVQSRDSRPMGDGHTAYMIRYIYLDEQHVNHDGETEVDPGTWDRLKPGQDIKVRYLPSDPTKSFIEGGLPPGGGTGTGFKLLALTLFVAACVVGWQALKTSAGEPPAPASRPRP